MCSCDQERYRESFFGKNKVAKRGARTALGMYELELAYMVVAGGQRDPGEYLAELRGYAAQPEGPLRRHAIDMALGRSSSALRNLVEAGPAHSAAALQLAREKARKPPLSPLRFFSDLACHCGSDRWGKREGTGELSEKHVSMCQAYTKGLKLSR